MKHFCTNCAAPLGEVPYASAPESLLCDKCRNNMTTTPMPDARTYSDTEIQTFLAQWAISDFSLTNLIKYSKEAVHIIRQLKSQRDAERQAAQSYSNACANLQFRIDAQKRMFEGDITRLQEQRDAANERTARAEAERDAARIEIERLRRIHNITL